MVKDKYGILSYYKGERDKYGIELILDMHECDTSTFTKENLSEYFTKLCKRINMKRYGEPMFWHDDGENPSLRGISAMQFIKTSNIVVHALELLKVVFVNIFSCKDFDTKVAKEFTKNFFKAKRVTSKVIERK